MAGDSKSSGMSSVSNVDIKSSCFLSSFLAGWGGVGGGGSDQEQFLCTCGTR